jgi:mannose-6-phosphate isomerase-like protein (cupin superfamily)
VKRIVVAGAPQGSTIVFAGDPVAAVRFGREVAPMVRAVVTVDGHTPSSPLPDGEVDVFELWGTAARPTASVDDPTVVMRDAPYQRDCGPWSTRWRLVRYGGGYEAPMHSTSTVDYDVVLSGAIDLVTSDDVVRLERGDSVVILGGEHAWRTEPGVPCEMAVVMLSIQALDRAAASPEEVG